MHQQLVKRPRRGARALAALAMATAALALVGCAMPNSSNPVLTVNSASTTGNSATLGMTIENPSDMDVRIQSVSWSLVYGPLPVGEGTWDLGVVVPSKERHQFSRQIRFDQPPIDPGATEVELSGVMKLETVGNAGDTALHEASFLSTARTGR